jgi:amino acid permease
MKYMKYIVVYFCLILSNLILLILFLNILGFIQIEKGNSFFLAFIIGPIFITTYHKYKPFKLTGDLDLKIKRFFNSYFESQKSCPNCDRVVKASELTPDGKCIYCKEEKNIK